MLDLSHINPANFTLETFVGTNTTAAQNWVAWQKPRGKTMCSIILLGKGGNGGTGSIGATVAGGGGGSSGTQVNLVMPIAYLPDTIYLSLIGKTATAGLISYISIYPNTTVNHIIAIGRGGANGGNAAAGTAGTAGGAPTIPLVSEMPFAWNYVQLALAGQAGSAGGGSQAAGGAVTLPTTGLIVTGGTGGGGSDVATATAGLAGGALTVPAQPSIFPAHPGGIAAASAGVPPGAGNNGYQPIPNLLFFYGGTGSGSTYNLATGAGLTQQPGGNGAYGCGGGGVGAGITGSAAALPGDGGESLAIIMCW